MNRFSGFLLIIAAPSGLLLALSGCGGGYGDDGGTSTSNQITSIDVTPAEATITSDGTQQFSAVASNASGGTVSAGSLDWRSSNAGVATVDNAGLATAVAAGTASITARKDTSGVYSGGGVVVSNEATLTVTSSTGVTGLAATPAPMGNALIILRDQAGNSQTIVTDAAGRFGASVAGMLPPFVLRVSNRRGQSLYSAAIEPGVVNINPLTDLLVRTWYLAHGTTADAAFNAAQAPGGPNARALESLSGALERAFGETLARQGLKLNDFSFFTTPYVADGTGLDRILAELRTSVDPSRLALHDGLTGRNAEVIFTSRNRAELRVRSRAGHVTAVPLLPDR